MGSKCLHCSFRLRLLLLEEVLRRCILVFGDNMALFLELMVVVSLDSVHVPVQSSLVACSAHVLWWKSLWITNSYSIYYHCIRVLCAYFPIKDS